jgi:hypothetical protein
MSTKKSAFLVKNNHNMKEVTKNKMSRRKILPILGGSLLIPLIGFGKTFDKTAVSSNDDEYKILLKADGTTIKVKTSALKNSKTIKKNISNNSFYNWLKKKF